ncbi:hypothetical protein NUW58_g1261 [Xylaria curta]|uniref:Uncharacterized protein n=1 Tax=Xylaria curta TaxID=42375 RepID=A0ACC1PME6_9PEZI|nr:hypothetical protein NUW58_g1261 [Xylaria curta]
MLRGNAVTVPSTITASAPTTATVTQRTATVYDGGDATVTLPTFTSGVGFQKTVATGTFKATVCANGAKPVTVTKYTGAYTPNSGQATTIPGTYPTQAFCTIALIHSFILFPTVTSGVVTTTVTPTSTVTDITTTSTSTIIFGTHVTYATTVTHSARRDNDGHRGSGRYANRTSVIYTRNEPWANDPGACCQACLDNKGCGASMGGGGAYGLYYSATEGGEPVCDAFIFSFTSTPDVLPGQGLINQNGCGRVEYQPEA